MTETSCSRSPSRLSEKRFQFLLISLLLLFILLPFFETSVVTDIVVSVILLMGAYAVSPRKTVFIICVVLATLALIMTWTAYFVQGRSLLLAGHGFNIAFFVLVSAVMLSRVLSARQVTAETIAGAICVYLFIGVIWADVFAILEAVDPNSFSGSQLQTASVEGVTSPQTESGHFTYYSFVTLTTLGYGEITPLSRPARSLAALEAVMGQLYIAVLIARLVGLQISSRRKRNCD